MSIFNRDYMRQSSGPFAPLRNWRAIEVIIAVNAAVFLAWNLFDRNEFMGLNFLTSWAHLRHGRVWTLVTYAFSHEDLWHIVLNMFVLWSFGRILEHQWGTRRFAVFYLVAGVSGGLAHCVLSLLGWPETNLLGASGAVAGFLVAFSILYPRQTVLFMLIIPMPVYVLTVLFVGYDLYGLVQQYGVSQSSDGTGHGAHLGGALIGAIYGLGLRGIIPLPDALLARVGTRRRRSRRRRSQTRAAPPARSSRDEQRMDELLEKVHRGGLDSLSREEREFMLRMSRKYRE